MLVKANTSMEPTLEDIANRVGVSISTVSRALSGDGRVSKETIDRVTEEAKRLNYKRRAKASRKRDEGTREDAKPRFEAADPGATLNSVAMVVWGPLARLESFYSESLMEVYQYAQQHRIELAWIREPLDKPLGTILRDVTCDGVLLFTWHELGNAERDALRKCPHPVVLVNRHVEGEGDACSVTLDDFSGGIQAARYLYALGHRRIAYVPGVLTSSSMTERAAGFRAALERYGCLDPSLIASSRVQPWTVEELMHVVKGFMEHPRPPTAIATYSDGSAQTVLVSLLDAGMRVPEDVSIVGYDNFRNLDEIEGVAMTSIDYRMRDLGAQAIHLCSCLVRGIVEPPVRWCVVPRLVEGSTSGPPPAAGV